MSRIVEYCTMDPFDTAFIDDGVHAVPMAPSRKRTYGSTVRVSARHVGGLIGDPHAKTLRLEKRQKQHHRRSLETAALVRLVQSPEVVTKSRHVTFNQKRDENAALTGQLVKTSSVEATSEHPPVHQEKNDVAAISGYINQLSKTSTKMKSSQLARSTNASRARVFENLPLGLPAFPRSKKPQTPTPMCQVAVPAIVPAIVSATVPATIQTSPPPTSTSVDESAEVIAINKVEDIKRNFEVDSVIGSGTFSTVYKARAKFKDRPYVALKRVVETCKSKYIEREVICLHKLGGKHNVARLHCVIRKEDITVLVLDYFDHEEFVDYYREMSVQQIRTYIYALLEVRVMCILLWCTCILSHRAEIFLLFALHPRRNMFTTAFIFMHGVQRSTLSRTASCRLLTLLSDKNPRELPTTD